LVAALQKQDGGDAARAGRRLRPSSHPA
jgi:hypothetical protein